MNTITKGFLAFSVVAGVFGLLAFFNVTPFRTIMETVIGGSANPGSSYGTAKIPAVVTSLASATSTSILNPYGLDVYVLGPNVSCQGVGTAKTAFTGAGLASLTMLIGTSSTAASATAAPFIPSQEVANLTIATSSVLFQLASSTQVTATSSNAILWAASTYMYFQWNATDTAVCTLGVSVLGS